MFEQERSWIFSSMANKVVAATGTGELAADSGKRPSSTLYVLIALATVGVAAIAYRILSKRPEAQKQVKSWGPQDLFP